MIVCTYSIHHETVRAMPVPGRHLWKIEMYITDGTEKVTKTVQNKKKCFITEILECCQEELKDLMTEFTVIEDAGFTIYLR